MGMTRLDVLYEWKLIEKFQKWLYNLHINPIAIFEYTFAMLSVVHKRLREPNTSKCGIKEDPNQNDDSIISRKLEQYQICLQIFRCLQMLIINIYVFTTRKDRLKICSAHIVF